MPKHHRITSKEPNHSASRRDTAGHDVRHHVLQALLRVVDNRASLAKVIPEIEPRVTARDRPLFRELTLGVCRWYHRLDIIARHFLQRPIQSRQNSTKLLIFIGLYQLLFTRIPAHAAIHSTVEVATRVNASQHKGLINGVLRSAQRDSQRLIEQWQHNAQYQYSHPQWLIDKLKSNWPDDWQSILDQNNQKAPLTLRINCRKTSRTAYARLLSENDIGHHFSLLSATGIILDKPMEVTEIPGYTEGLFSVQDAAAQLCPQLLDLEPVADTSARLTILDACAAPGGKTTAILEQSSEPSRLTALELYPNRLPRIADNLQRLGLAADMVIGDATQKDWWDGKQFDRILIDAPCSASGVIRKHPDIKLLRLESDIVPLAETQLAILDNLWPLLKTGGLLVYATCSVFPQENTRIIERFIKQTSNAQEIRIEATWGRPCTRGRQLFPSQDSNDGFYYAKLLKKPT